MSECEIVKSLKLEISILKDERNEGLQEINNLLVKVEWLECAISLLRSKLVKNGIPSNVSIFKKEMEK